MKKRILIIEDDNDISNFIATVLNNNYEIKQVYSGTEALLLLQLEQFDLILVDLMLPGKTGEEVLQEARQNLALEVPIIVLTAMSDKETTTRLLLAGADDYLTKPFDPSELLARIIVQLRKTTNTEQIEDVVELQIHNLTLQPDTFSCKVKNEEIALSLKEYKILELLLLNPKKIFTKEMIYANVWDDDYFFDENTINVHISKLRNKLKQYDEQQEYIETVWGIGIRLKGAKA